MLKAETAGVHKVLDLRQKIERNKLSRNMEKSLVLFCVNQSYF